MKRLIAAAAVLAVGVSIAVTSVGGAQQSGERTLKFVEKGGSGKFIDNPPKASKRHPRPSAGDELLFTTGLYDTNNARAGTVRGHCVKEPGAGNAFDCQADATLKDGTLALSAVTNETSLKTVIAITGGTGAYEGARGSIVSIARSHADNAPSDDTVHLLG